MGVMVGSFPLSLDAGVEGTGVGNLAAGEATVGGRQTIEGETFSFFFMCFASSSEEVGCPFDFLF